MSKYERDKGIRIEREIINLHRELGIKAERVPLSGAAGYKDAGHDVDVYPLGNEDAPFVCEVKGRHSGAGFTLLERWLSDYDALFLRRDRQEPLVVLPWRAWVAVLTELKSRQSQIKERSVGVLLTSTLLKPKNGQDGATCEPREQRRGDDNVNPVKP